MKKLTKDIVNANISKRMQVLEGNYTKLVKTYEKRLTQQYFEALKAINDELKKLYLKVNLSNISKDNLNEINKYNRLSSLKRQIKDELTKLLPENSKAISESIKSVFEAGYYGMNWAIETSTALDFAMPILQTEIIKASLLNPVDAIKWEERLKKNLAQTIADTQNTITQGLIKGQGFRVTAKDLRDKLTIGRNKAIRIVRTESHRAIIEGKNNATDKLMPKADKLGLEPVKKLIAVRDNRTRPQSASMDGQIADKDGLFTYPDGTRGLPGQTGVAEYDINDRETIIMEFNNWSPEIAEKRRQREELYGATFDDWRKKQGLTKNIYGQKYE